MTQKPNSKDGAPGETDKAENEEVFQGKHPWVVSSPHTRVQVTGPADQAAQSAVEDQVNSTAVTATPAATADQTDPEVITHLRALKKALGSLPEQLEEQLKSLEAKTDKTLTHGHINKLGKLQKQLANLNTKISEMDHNWKVFTETVMQKFGHHQKMYQQCRQKLLQEYLQKSQEIQEAKEEVQNASEALFQAQVAEPPPAVEPLDVDSIFESAVQDDAYMDMEQDGEDYAEVELVRDKSKPAVAAFRRGRQPPTSPTKVHAGHLKKAA